MLVIVHPNKNGATGLSSKKEYLLSACTRARTDLIIVIMDYAKKIDKLSDVIAYKLGQPIDGIDETIE